MQHDVAACQSMLQLDMLLPFRACCSWTCSRLFQHVAARHIAACLIILQLDMLPPFRACCSGTCCRLFEHVAARHVAAFSSILQPDMLPPVQAFCSLFEYVVAPIEYLAAFQSRQVIVQLRLLLTRDTSRWSAGLFSVGTSRCSAGARAGIQVPSGPAYAPLMQICPEAANGPFVRTLPGAAQAPVLQTHPGGALASIVIYFRKYMCSSGPVCRSVGTASFY